MTARAAPDVVKNILVVGAGLIGARHLRMVRDHPGCRLAGVVDPHIGLDPDVPQFGAIADVDVPVDGAIIATPTQLHAEHGIAAAKRGWHILMEKPVASDVAEAQALRAAVDRYGVRCIVGHHRRYHASVQRLREVIAQGQIGAPVTATLIWAVRKPDSYFDAAWRATGGSPIMINLVHDIDLLRYVLGEVTDVVGLGSGLQRNADRIESGGAVLRFASGACATISFADTAPSPWGFEAGTAENPNIASTGQDMWWTTGTRGGIAFPSLTCWSGSEDWSNAPTPHQFDAAKTIPLEAQLTHFLDVIKGDATPLIDIRDATETLRVTTALQNAIAPTLTASKEDD
ncbi:Gfo/Idh/MocA family oxidoreductase [Yoonia sp. SS1-5]|uniref:Gfo/Idh/MocA family protein n=1 Tax=Yoonia rhodophyticola TaxID=3137370 RepID=A0AAN0MEU8_9RHOB